MSDNNADLVHNGYTISTSLAAFGRVGERYVMRDNKGHQVELPLTAGADHLRLVWEAFERAAAGNEPMPASMIGEAVFVRRPPKAVVAPGPMG